MFGKKKEIEDDTDIQQKADESEKKRSSKKKKPREETKTEQNVEKDPTKPRKDRKKDRSEARKARKEASESKKTRKNDSGDEAPPVDKKAKKSSKKEKEEKASGYSTNSYLTKSDIGNSPLLMPKAYDLISKSLNSSPAFDNEQIMRAYLNTFFTEKKQNPMYLVKFLAMYPSCTNYAMRLMKRYYGRTHSADLFIDCWKAIEENNSKAGKRLEVKKVHSGLKSDLLDCLEEAIIYEKVPPVTPLGVIGEEAKSFIKDERYLAKRKMRSSENDVDSWQFSILCAFIDEIINSFGRPIVYSLEVFTKFNGKPLKFLLGHADREDHTGYRTLRYRYRSYFEGMGTYLCEHGITLHDFADYYRLFEQGSSLNSNTYAEMLDKIAAVILEKELSECNTPDSFLHRLEEIKADGVYKNCAKNSTTDRVMKEKATFFIGTCKTMSEVMAWFSTIDDLKFHPEAVKMAKSTYLAILGLCTDVEGLETAYRDAKQFSECGITVYGNMFCQIVRTNFPDITTLCDWYQRAPPKVQELTNVRQMMRTRYEAEIQGCDDCDMLVQVYLDCSEEFVREDCAGTFSKRYAEISRDNGIEEYDNDFDRLGGLTQSYTVVESALTTAGGREILEYFHEKLKADLKHENQERIRSDVCSRLMEALSGNFHPDGTVDSLEDCKLYLDYCNGYIGCEDNIKARVCGILAANGEWDQEYEKYFTDGTSFVDDYRNFTVEEDRQYDTFLTMLSETRFEGSVSECYRALVFKKVEESIIRYNLSYYVLEKLMAAIPTELPHDNMVLLYAARSYCRDKSVNPPESSDIVNYVVKATGWHKNGGYLPMPTEDWYLIIDKTEPNGGFKFAVLKAIEADICSYNGLSGKAFERFDSAIGTLKQHGFLEKYPDLVDKMCTNIYEQYIQVHEYAQAERVAEMHSNKTATLVMVAYAKYLGSEDKRQVVGRLAAELESNIKKIQISDYNLLAAAYYVDAVMNNALMDWEMMNQAIDNGMKQIAPNNYNTALLQARYMILQAETAMNDNRRSESQNLFNKALRILRKLPQSATVTRLQDYCDNKLSSEAEDTIQTMRVNAPAVNNVPDIMFYEGKYRLNPVPIGEGGAYRAFLATETSNNRVCVLRVPFKVRDISNPATYPTFNAAMLDAFDYEMEIWDDLSRNIPSNVINLLEYKKSPFPWAACEYGDNDAEKSYMNMSWSERVKMIISVVTALEYMHSKHMIHNDIKPNNIFHVEDHWELSDFDSTFFEGDPKKINVTHSYASPELISCGNDLKKAEELTVKSDIWSVGVVLYYALDNGHLPFEGAGEAYDENVIAGRYKAGKFPRNYEEVFERVFSVNPEERPSATELKEMLMKLI